MFSLDLPPELCQLLVTGAWPLSAEEAKHQNVSPGVVPRELVERLVPGEHQLYLLPPPFMTVAERLHGAERRYWEKFGALAQIDPARTLVLGDFGLGSDATIALDYRGGAGSPAVIRQDWTQGSPAPQWVLFFPTFAAFAEAFNLKTYRWR